MNYQKLIGLGLACFFCMAVSVAQNKAPLNEPDYNRPALFDGLPSTITVSVDELTRLLNADRDNNTEISFKLPENNTLSTLNGKVISAATRSENNMRSVVIRLNNFNGATLTLSSSTNPDGTVSYRGRIVSFKHADAFELQQRGNQYVLVKKNFYELFNE